MGQAIYDCIDKYEITAVCQEPLHVGSFSGDKGEVLIHPVEDVPFIQATSICGVLRNYCMKISDKSTVQSLFGDREDDKESKIKVSDGKFKPGKDLNIELRPHVKIDPETGTVSSAKVKGEGDVYSGQKFDMQYVAAGAEFSFDIYIFGGTNKEKSLILKALAAMNAEKIQIGGQKSNGCGYIKITKALSEHFDMRNKMDRLNWISESESGLVPVELPEIDNTDYLNAYEIEIEAETENELLIKGIALDKFGKDAPKAENIKNAKGEYIIPGSSIKGAIRNRMEMIADYMKLNPELISDGFGEIANNDIPGKAGNLKFRDIIVGDETGNNEILHTRIHIDKFTGGVINGGLFSELNVFGGLNIHIQVTDQNNPEAVTGLLMLALRDLCYKLYALGGGQNVGKGYINVKNICIIDTRTNKKCRLDQNCEALEGKEILDECMNKLQGQIVA